MAIESNTEANFQTKKDSNRLVRAKSGHGMAFGKPTPKKPANNKKPKKARTKQQQSFSSSNESNDSDLNEYFIDMDEKAMTSYFKRLPAAEKSLIENIICQDAEMKQTSFKIITL